MDSIFEVEFMYPVTGAVQAEVEYVEAHDAEEAIYAVKQINKRMIREEEFHFLGIHKIRDKMDVEVIPREKWEEK